MRDFFVLLLYIIMCTDRVSAQDSRLFDRLDSVLDNRESILQNKQKRINSLSEWIRRESNVERKLRLYDDIYHEYYVYQFDSAMNYVNKSLQLAKSVNNNYYYQKSLINKAELLGIGSLYLESIRCIEEVDTASLNSQQRFDYYIALYRIYSYCSEYANDDTYAPRCSYLAGKYLGKILPYIDKEDISYNYYRGEYVVNALKDEKKADKYYLQALRILPEDSRFYAMSCFVLADHYKKSGDNARYADFLAKAAISDLEGCTMENSALRDLALFLFRTDDNEIERAQRYINVALDDAKFYHNRLRVIQVSEAMPAIVSKYQEIIDNRVKRQHVIMIVLIVLSVFSISAIILVFRQNRILAQQRHKLSSANVQLSELNNKQKELNDRLRELNKELIDTDHKREGFAKIYIDLCAKYIRRLNNYKILVKRKIQAHQEKELLTHISSTKLSEEDASSFLTLFDKGFLELHPNFISDFNNLLRPESRIATPNNHALTPELRIYALVNLGVKESNEIAGLLFLSPQTIYNYRTSIRNRAINRETFDADVRRIS